MKRSRILGFLITLALGCFVIYRASQTDPQAFAQQLLAHADIQINGDRPWDIAVHNQALFARVLGQGSLGLGESYMDGWWDSPALDQFFFKILRANLAQKMPCAFNSILTCLKSKFLNLQSKSRAFQVGEQHYDLGDDLFTAMLDKHMLYSCAYWLHAYDLQRAQDDKLELICKKLYLKPGMKLLDIGCGWGGLARYAAKNYGVNVIGVTISKEQANYAQTINKDFPVEIRLQDYRDLHETFDRIVSVGMFEHVGYKNYRTFMDVTHHLLADDGLMLLHTIGGNVSRSQGDDWLDTYIFPNGMLPSIAQIGTSIEELFVMEDWHNFGANYDKTLMAWWHNFEKSWPHLETRYGPRFYRMWKYYLLSCAGAFRARDIQLWQIVLSKKGILGGYRSVR